MTGEIVELVAQRHEGAEETPYERLLGDALEGDASLFARYDSIEAAWRTVAPILGNAAPLKPYEPQSWGPVEAASLTDNDGGWHDPSSGKPSAEAIDDNSH